MDMFQGRMDLAVKYGADVAIFVHNLVYWVEKNAANGKNFHDGRYWTYNTMEAFVRLYPLWSRDQIKRIIKRCEELGLILTGDYNKDRRDRTKWYSPSDEILELYSLGEIANCKGRKRQMQVAESPDTSGEIAPALPSIYQEDTNTPLNPPKGEKGKRKNRYDLDEDAKPLLQEYCKDDRELARAMGDFIEMRKSLRAINSKKAIRMLLAELDRLSAGNRESKLLLIRQSITNSWKSVFPLKGGQAPVAEPAKKEFKPRKYHMEVINGEEVVVFDD